MATNFSLDNIPPSKLAFTKALNDCLILCKEENYAKEEKIMPEQSLRMFFTTTQVIYTKEHPYSKQVQNE